MAKKKSKSKTKAKKTKAIAKRTEDKKLLWLGAQRLMVKPTDDKGLREQNTILLASKVLAVSPFGINILGSIPYINKLGLKQKAKEYSPKVKFVYHWVQRSQNDEDKAICECKLQVGGKDLCDWITGECSPSSMKMGTLKGYQNHMAQTRARNRAIDEVFGDRMHKEMMRNIERAYINKVITPEEVKNVGMVTNFSAEEMQDNGKKEQKKLIVEEIRGEKIQELKKMLKGSTTQAKLVDLKKRSGIALPNFNITERHASILIAGLLSSEVKQ